MNKLLLALSTILLYACSKSSNDQRPAPPPQLKVDSSALTLGASKNSIDSFNIQYSGSWKINFNPSTVSWLKTSTSSGSGNAKIYVTAEQDNTSGADQTATIIVTPNDDASKAINVSVIQKRSIPTLLWSKLYGGGGDDRFTDVIQTPDGGYIGVGDNQSADGDISVNKGLSDIWAVKVDANGSKVWEKSYGGSSVEFGSSIARTPDGNFVIAAQSKSTDGDISSNKGGSDLFVFKIDGSGNILWKKTYGGTQGEYVYSNTHIAATSDGGCVIAAGTISNDGDVSGNHGDEDLWAIKLDQNGTVLWSKTFGGTLREEASGIVASPDGGFVIAGGAESIDGDVTNNHPVTGDVWLVKIDANGNKQWQTTVGGSQSDWANAITATSDNGFMIAATTFSIDGDVSGNHGDYDAWIIKIDGNGNKVWAKTYGGSGYDDAQSIIKVNNGFVITAITHSTDGDVIPSNGIVGAWIFQIDDTGKIIWQKNFGGSNGGEAYAVIPTSDGNFVASGLTSSNDGDVSGNHGKTDAWIFKISEK